jgi:signal peptidase I
LSVKFVAQMAVFLSTVAFSSDTYVVTANGMAPFLPFSSCFRIVEADSIERGDVVAYRTSILGKERVDVGRVAATATQRISIGSSSFAVDGRVVRQMSESADICALSKQKLRDAEVISDGYVCKREKVMGREYQVLINIDAEMLEAPMEKTVPPKHYFVLGDNRRDALDSRKVGPIPRAMILGRAHPCSKTGSDTRVP